MEPKLEKLARLLNSNSLEGSESIILDQFTEVFTWLNAIDTENFRKNHFKLSELMHQQKTTDCFPFLCKIILDSFNKLLSLNTHTHNQNIEEKLSDDNFMVFLKATIQRISNSNFRILDFKIIEPLPFPVDSILDKVNELLEYYLTQTEVKIIDSLYMVGPLLAISRVLSKKQETLHETYVLFESVLNQISIDGYQQVARDYAEETIYCSRDDGHSEYGHYCRLSLANSQYNSIDAGIHGCLLVDSLRYKESIPKDFLFRILTVFFTFFRNFNLYKFAEMTYELIHAEFDLDAYNAQKIQMAYLNLLLSQNPEKALIHADKYSKKNIDKIKKFEAAALIPWFVLICNLKGILSNKFEEYDGLVLLEKAIELILPIEIINSYRNMILPNRKDTKNVLIDMMDKLHLTRNKSDHVHDVRYVQLTASRLLESSLDSGDFEGIILSHRAMSDGSLAFELSEGLPPDLLVSHDRDTLNKFNGKSAQYFIQTKEFLRTCKDYRHLWLGFSGENLYFILHDQGEFVTSGIIPKIEKNIIFKWLNEELPELAFEDNPVTKSILETRRDIWFDQSNAIRKNLPKIFLPPSNKHTIVFCDTDMSCFPHNFLIEPTDSYSIQSICNPLSLDNYLNYKHLNIDIKKISVWAPLIEEDTAIRFAFERLKDHLHNENVIFSEGLLPEFSYQTDIKIFICHGGRAKSGGFTGLYPGNNKKYKSTSVFGKGKVAILFICHGGHIQSDFYARSFQTLAKNLLMEGYETVVAPSWSLNIAIPGPWMEEFLANLGLGVKIIEACLAANNKIKEIYPVESAWAAMHIFGNPNIKVDSEPHPIEVI